MFNPLQLFFKQRLLESLDFRAIDSYRVRVLNPLRAIEELQVVYRGRIKKKVKNHRDLEYVVKETMALLKNDSTLQYSGFTKDFYLKFTRRCRR